jgi:hypothetical protein
MVAMFRQYWWVVLAVVVGFVVRVALMASRRR